MDGLQACPGVVTRTLEVEDAHEGLRCFGSRQRGRGT